MEYPIATGSRPIAMGRPVVKSSGQRRAAGRDDVS